MSKQVDCSVCNGTGRREVPADTKFLKSTAGYSFDALTDTHTLPCRNCGGQTMSCRGTGKVNTRPDGTPCIHEYKYESLGRCYHGYTCIHCGDRYTIDSGD